MKELDVEKTNGQLKQLINCELVGVVFYTLCSQEVTGPNRIPIVNFFKTQATESLLHAQQVGEILTGLKDHQTYKFLVKEFRVHPSFAIGKNTQDTSGHVRWQYD